MTGGFPYTGIFYGITPIWASEIEPWPIKVTEKHFPDIKHLGDITQINGAEIEPVDVITFGSPCTKLSVAGRHDGFDITFECQGTKDEPHKIYTNNIRATDKYQYIYKDTCPICGEEILRTNESALFFHAVRIIRQMRTATGGGYPRFAVWENVPGAFSSNKGEDFRAVLEEITEAEIPMPRSGKWATAGMVRTERVDVAWRVLDAQHWGVPQRRRRIFLVADFGGQCAGEILFIEEGLRGHFAESRKAREEVAATVGDGIDKSNCLTPWDVQSKRIHGEDGVWPTLYSHEGGGGAHGYIAQEIIPFDTTQITSPQNGNNPKPNDPCHSLVGYGEYAADKIASPIRSSGGDCGGGSDVLVTKLYDMSHGDEVMRPVKEGIAPTLNSRMGTGGNQVPVMMQHYAVRRLTPLECLRLQGFPDYWLDIEGMSDTQKYKAVGNSVAIPCVKFVLGGIARVLGGEKE